MDQIMRIFFLQIQIPTSVHTVVESALQVGVSNKTIYCNETSKMVYMSERNYKQFLNFFDFKTSMERGHIIPLNLDIIGLVHALVPFFYKILRGLR